MKTSPFSLSPGLMILVVLLLALGSAALSPISPLQHGILPSTPPPASTPAPDLPANEVSMDLIVLLSSLLLLIILFPMVLSLRAGAGKDRSAEK
ncbi:MAG: hypothetical protein ACUVRJ_02005 [Candidatus Villigracilaceae bacterium]